MGYGMGFGEKRVHYGCFFDIFLRGDFLWGLVVPPEKTALFPYSNPHSVNKDNHLEGGLIDGVEYWWCGDLCAFGELFPRHTPCTTAKTPSSGQ